MKNVETGKTGENLACEYLLKNGYLILARNYKVGVDEIDIIARAKSGDLIFCEVKTINDKFGFSGGFMPEDNLSPRKLRKMVRASRIFLSRYPALLRNNEGWQLDFIAIVLSSGRLTKLRHYQNI
jgi:putative endonuclease